jgi:hypothetical protein
MPLGNASYHPQAVDRFAGESAQRRQMNSNARWIAIRLTRD